jgi:glucokinase
MTTLPRLEDAPSVLNAPNVGGLLVGVDLGGSKIAALVADQDRQPMADVEVPFVGGDARLTIATVADLVRDALRLVDGTSARVAVVGVASPGQVDAQGTVRRAVNLGADDIPLGRGLADALGVPCVVENDARAAALWTLERGDAGTTDLAYVNLGTGVSAGLILDGRLHRGPRGMAGEIGHLVFDPDGPRCPCGLRGCVETLVSGPAIEAQAGARLAAGEASVLADRTELRASDVFEAAQAGDALATEIASAAAAVLARVIHGLVMAFDVERVVLGGGVARAGRSLLAPIEAELEHLREASALAAEMVPPHLLRLAPAGENAGCRGAIVLAQRASRGLSGPAGR